MYQKQDNAQQEYIKFEQIQSDVFQFSKGTFIGCYTIF